jgi:predicted dehydrogenase
MKAVKAGLSSFGMSAYVFHGPLLKVNPGFEITAVVERHKNLSRKDYSSSTLYRSFDEMIEDTSIELVIINTPDFLHYEYTKKALEKGKHVVVEKPFTSTYAEAEELIELARKKGSMLTVFQNRRWDGDFLTVKKVMEENLLGRLVEFESHFDRFRNYIQPSTWKEEPGAGTLYNLGSHMIDQACQLFGYPEAVHAVLSKNRDHSKVDDSFDLRLRYKGLKVTVKGSYLVKEPGPRYTLHGTEGSFLKWGIDPQEERLKQGWLPDETGFGEEEETDWGWLNTRLSGMDFRGQIKTVTGNYSHFYDNIYNDIRKGERIFVDPDQSAMVIRIIEKAFQSDRERKEISL